jgi:hypothetical protein
VFAHFYGIRPWEMNRLTVAEFDALADSYDQREK